MTRRRQRRRARPRARGRAGRAARCSTTRRRRADAPGRDGAAKAGNLNSAAGDAAPRSTRRSATSRRATPTTSSARTAFLREVVGQLEADERLAFVQTIKEAQVSAGDPFNNRESMFYRGQMLARNAANAVFPCGSGVVWRRDARCTRSATSRPGTWSRTSSPASRRCAAAGTASTCRSSAPSASTRPRTCPNVYKQRGTWAIDTVRLMVWGNLRGLKLRQRAHFTEMLRLLPQRASSVLVYIPSIVCTLLGWTAARRDRRPATCMHMIPLVARHRDLAAGGQRALQRPPQEAAPADPRALAGRGSCGPGWRPIYMKASIQALLGGAAAQAGLQGHAQGSTTCAGTGATRCRRPRSCCSSCSC